MTTSAENITFILVRGVIALAIVGVGFFCISQGIHYFALPRLEAEQIHLSFVGLELSANGLGAVIFGTGVALCFVGKRAAPARIEARRSTETVGSNSEIPRPLPVQSAVAAPSILSSDSPVPSKYLQKEPITAGTPPTDPPELLLRQVAPQSRSGTEVSLLGREFSPAPSLPLYPRPPEHQTSSTYSSTKTTDESVVFGGFENKDRRNRSDSEPPPPLDPLDDMRF